MNKDYMKPTMRVVQLHHQHIICASPFGAQGLRNSENINWKDDGFDDEDYDY